MLFQLTSDDKLQILTQLSFHKFVVQNTFVINYFVLGPLWKVEKKALEGCNKSWRKSWVEYHIFLGTNFLGQFNVRNFEWSYCLNGESFWPNFKTESQAIVSAISWTSADTSVSYRRRRAELLLSGARWRCIAHGTWHSTWHDITWHSMV